MCTWSVELSEASIEEDIEDPIHQIDLKYGYQLYQKDRATNYTVALINGDRSYTTCEQLGVPENTYWESDREISLILPEEDMSGQSAVLTTRFWCCWNQPDTGCIRPAFLLANGKLQDCNTAPGSWVYPAAMGPLAVEGVLYAHKGDTWREVGVDARPLNTVLQPFSTRRPIFTMAARILTDEGKPKDDWKTGDKMLDLAPPAVWDPVLIANAVAAKKTRSLQRSAFTRRGQPEVEIIDLHAIAGEAPARLKRSVEAEEGGAQETPSGFLSDYPGYIHRGN